MMEKKGLLSLLVILLGLSYLVFAVAVPATRIPKAREVDSSEPHHLTKKDIDVVEQVEFQMKEGYGEGRMMMNMIDYAGAKANPAHAPPKPPGKPSIYPTY